MALSNNDIKQEKDYLEFATEEISKKIDILGKEIHVKNEKITEFKKVLWENRGSIDGVEMQTELMSSQLEANFVLTKMNYYRKLLKLEYSPYFGRIDFKEDNLDTRKVYIGIANVEKDLNYIIYDWRSPIASLFYDYSKGKAKYTAPDGEIKGEILLKRQYKIEGKKLLRVFDNNLNIVDDMLQEVLSSSSSDKMKNIVNTIQQEQNEIIRNISNKNLIVQGIAGSGKTSVALHRIAFLLYKIKNLKSSNVLIFSPNKIFSEYISNVLPELGEENTSETTFSEFASHYIKEFKSVESFSGFIEKYYTNKRDDEDLIRFKLSNKMIKVIENYVQEIDKNIKIIDNIETKFSLIEKEYLNYLLKDRYNKMPIFERMDYIAEHLCNKLGLISKKDKISITKKIKEVLSIKPDYKKLYKDLFISDSFSSSFNKSINLKLNSKVINYDDALCFIYLKGLLNGFPYSNLIKQVVIDEAQDYNEMQYIILTKIFKRASFTLLGDVNQTINPYQKYDSLEVLKNILDGNTKYVELSKTYRSSKEIIEFTNKILNLKYGSAIRKEESVPVIKRDDDKYLKNDINYLKNKYKSLAIITKDMLDAIKLYDLLKDDYKDISLVTNNSSKFNRDLIIIPSYLSKGLEFDSVISYTSKNNLYTKKEKYLYYVVLTRCQHELIVYNNSL
mgnify:FL=1